MYEAEDEWILCSWYPDGTYHDEHPTSLDVVND